MNDAHVRLTDTRGEDSPLMGDNAKPQSSARRVNILHFASYDAGGGAAKAAYLIHCLLRDEGHNSVLLVRNKESPDRDVVKIGIKSVLSGDMDSAMERVRTRLAGWKNVKTISDYPFNLNVAPILDWAGIDKAMSQPDVLFLHWVKDFLTVGDICRLYQKYRCPIVWILMDMETMTGGCHCPLDCLQYRSGCTKCPQLASKPEWVSRTWREKKRQLSEVPISFVVQTEFQRDVFVNSGLFGGVAPLTIPSPIHKAMKPLEAATARKILDLPADKKIILAGAHKITHTLKGGDIFRESLTILSEKHLSGTSRCGLSVNDVLVVTVGGSDGYGYKLVSGFQHRHLGHIREEIVMALVFQAADVFASTSIFEAGSQMVSQSMLCGTPVVAFETGNAPELLGDGRAGYMARLGDPEDFALGLNLMLNDDGTAGQNAAKIAADYQGIPVIKKAYMELLEKVAVDLSGIQGRRS